MYVCVCVYTFINYIICDMIIYMELGSENRYMLVVT